MKKAAKAQTMVTSGGGRGVVDPWDRLVRFWPEDTDAIRRAASNCGRLLAMALKCGWEDESLPFMAFTRTLQAWAMTPEGEDELRGMDSDELLLYLSLIYVGPEGEGFADQRGSFAVLTEELALQLLAVGEGVEGEEVANFLCFFSGLSDRTAWAFIDAGFDEEVAYHYATFDGLYPDTLMRLNLIEPDNDQRLTALTPERWARRSSSH